MKRYVIVIEDYYDEEYLGNVYSEDRIKDYKNSYFGHTREMEEWELVRVLPLAFYAKWYKVIDLEENRFLNDSETQQIYSRNREVWDRILKEPRYADRFFGNFRFNYEI